MADDILGSLAVEIVGDYSDLQPSIDAATGVAEAGAAKIADAFDVPLGDAMVASLGSLVDQINSAGQSADAAGGQMALFGQDTTTALSDVNEQLSLFDTNGIAATDEAFGSLAQSADAAVAPVQEVGHAGQEAESGLAGMVEQLTLLGEALAITEGLKEFGQEALTAYGTVQSVTIGLTALTGSAEKADEIVTQVKELAATEPFAFPEIAPTVQKMVALGVSADQVKTVMQAAADASAATGNEFGQVANALDRMSLSGTASSRILASLGISTQDLGNAMGVTAGEATAAFKALDQSERIDVLSTALSKFAGTAEAEAQGIAGQWQIFKNQFEEAMVGVGAALAPAVSHILDFGKDVLQVVQGAIQGFAALPDPVQDVAIALGLIAAAAVPVTAGLAAIGLAASGLEAIPGIFAALTTAIGLTSTAEEGLAISAGTATTALEAEGAAAVTTAGEMDTAAVAAGAGGLTGALRLLGPAAAVAAAVFAGWSLGVWAADVKSASQQLQDLSGYAHDLGLKFDQTSASGNEFAKSLAKLEAEAAAEDITVEKAGKTEAEYALTLLSAMKASDDATLAAYNLEHGITAADGATKQHELSAVQLAQKISELRDRLFDANTALIEVGTDHRNDANYADLHAAAVKQVNDAQKALSAALGETAAKGESYATAMKHMSEGMATVPTMAQTVQKAIDDIDAKVLLSNDRLNTAIEVYKAMAAQAGTTAQQLAVAWKQIETDASAAGLPLDQVKQKITDAASAAAGLQQVIVNGHPVWVAAAQDASDLTQATSDEYQSFVNANSAASNFTDGIVQLRGATDGAKQSTDDLSQSWVFTDGVWITALDLIKQVNSELDNQATAAQNAANALDSEAAAWDAVDTASTKASSKKGGSQSASTLGPLASGIVGSGVAGLTSGIVGSGLGNVGLITLGGSNLDTGNLFGLNRAVVQMPTQGGADTGGISSSPGPRSVQAVDFVKEFVTALTNPNYIAPSTASGGAGGSSGVPLLTDPAAIAQAKTQIADLEAQIKLLGSSAGDNADLISIAQAAIDTLNRELGTAGSSSGLTPAVTAVGLAAQGTTAAVNTVTQAVASLGDPTITTSVTTTAAAVKDFAVGAAGQFGTVVNSLGDQLTKFGTVVSSTGQILAGALTTLTNLNVIASSTPGGTPIAADPNTGVAGSPQYTLVGGKWVQTGTFQGFTNTLLTPQGTPSYTPPSPTTGLPSSQIGNQSGATLNVAVNFGGATIYGQAGADAVANTLTNALRTNAGLKLFG